MSQNNIRLLRRLNEAFDARDVDRVDQVFHAEGEFRTLAIGFEGSDGVYRRGELERYMRNLDQVFEAWRVEDVSFIEASDECVVQLHRVTGRGSGSGVPIDRRLGIVWTFRDGLIFRGQVFDTPQAAMEAVGLSE
jgi:ketosteroid isomerase-like protein